MTSLIPEHDKIFGVTNEWKLSKVSRNFSGTNNTIQACSFIYSARDL